MALSRGGRREEHGSFVAAKGFPMTISTSTSHVVSEQPDLTEVSLDALPTVDTADAAAVVDRVVGSPERDQQEQV
jgi:FXSXX-COOH protein